MKKFLVFLVAVAMVFTLTGCGEKEVDNDKKTPDAPIQEDNNNNASNSEGVNPEVKKFFDDYEAFMNEYIDFVASYKEQNSPVSMLTRYMEFMKSAAEYASKSDEYMNNSDDFTAADTAYMIEMNARIQKRLLELAQ
ncbi:MAG: hypothetical protein HFE04_00120 [Bacilli bacterium]|nr:hypothetical protein [Bacilli bacterium]